MTIAQPHAYGEEASMKFFSDDSDVDEAGRVSTKRRKVEDSEEFVLPPGFLAPLNPPLNIAPLSQAPLPSARTAPVDSCKQFWKAGDYEVPPTSSSSFSKGLDHARVHPKFLHSNATSHKWALGAFAELLDNAVDEISHGATYVTVDVFENKKDKNQMLLVQDNGGGMNACTIRHCMSLGYSVKSKIANTIGQYGNGFKTSTMRLGADVIVFTLCRGKDGENPTQSIGMLSYTFLRSTGKDDIVVPILDYEKRGLDSWKQVIRSSIEDWNTNLESILQWSPFSSEAELVKEFELMGEQGTRVIIYNLWDLEPGMLELDFDSESDDIQLRGINRDEQLIEMGQKYPSSRHYVTYQHSLRSYASILYLKLPAQFRIILRGKVVEHHSLVDDMMLIAETKYTPFTAPEQSAPLTVGFVKDAKHHIDIQGFSVYHKNRLIKPFWKVWTTTSCHGRGIIGVVEANFVEPAHDKQGFESTPVLERLKGKLNAEQKKYWRKNYEKVGYIAPEKTREQKSKIPYASPEGQPGQHVENQQLDHDRMLRREEVQSANLQVERETKDTVETVCSVDENMHDSCTCASSSDAELLAENNKLKEKLRMSQAFCLKVRADLVQKDQQIERIKNAANGKDQQIGRLAHEINVKDQQIERLVHETKGKDQQIEKLIHETNEKDKQIERLVRQTNEKDQQIGRLAHETNVKDQQIERLVHETKGKDQQIEKLVHETKGKDQQIERLVRETNEKDQQIGRLAHETNVKDQQIERFVHETKGKDQQIQKLVHETNEKDKQIERLVHETNEKDQQIERLKNEAEARMEVVNPERNQRDNKEKDQTQIDCDTKEHNQFNLHGYSSDAQLLAENNKLKEKLKMLHDFCLKVKANLMEKDRRSERLKNEATEKDQQIERLKKETKARIEVVNQERNRRDNEEAILRIKLVEAQAVIKNLQKSQVLPEAVNMNKVHVQV